MPLTPDGAEGVAGPARIPKPASSPLESPAAGTLSQVYAANRLMLVRLAYLLTGDLETGNDVVQDVFEGLQRRRVDPASIQNQTGYLYTAVVNRSRSAVRRRKVRTVTHRLFSGPEAPLTPEASLLLGEEQREVIDAVRQLPRRQREVIVLRFWGDLSEAEIAAALDIAKGTVKSTASRALKSIQATIELRRQHSEQ